MAEVVEVTEVVEVAEVELAEVELAEVAKDKADGTRLEALATLAHPMENFCSRERKQNAAFARL